MKKIVLVFYVILVIMSILTALAIRYCQFPESIIVSLKDLEVARFRFSGSGSFNFKVCDISRFSFDDLEIECNANTPWRNIDTVIQLLLSNSFRFESLRINIRGGGEVIQKFPSSAVIRTLANHRWTVTGHNLLRTLSEPITSDRESEREYVGIAQLGPDDAVYKGYSANGICLDSRLKAKVCVCLFYIPGNARMDIVVTAVDRIRSTGYAQVVCLEGTAPGRWPPYYISRLMSELSQDYTPDG